MILKKLVLLLLLVSNIVLAQEFKGLPVENHSKQLLDSKFKSYQLLELNVGAVQTALSTRSNTHQLLINASPLNWNLTLTEYDLFKKEFYVSIAGKNGVIKKNDKAGIKTYKVIPNTKRAGLSCLTVTDHFLYGFVEEAGIKTYIEPLRYFDETAAEDQFIVYKETDVIPVSGLKCGSEELQENIHIGDREINNPKNGQRAGCITVDIAIACDKTIYDNKGGVSNSEAFVTGVMNNVQTNYDNEFTTDIEFNISTIFVATTTADDPWTNVNNINAHLDVHKSWANGGGYGGASYAVATAWTRKYTSGAIGLAWVQSLCGSYRYNVCSDFGGTAGLLRCLQAHELGHNFSAGHDGANTGFIMAPAVSNSTTWSPASQSAINGYVKTVGCVGVCNGGTPPVADFFGSPTIICPNSTVKFTDASSGTPNSWLWTLPGGTPNTSTQQSPIVQYKLTGIYDVTLKVTNTFGSNTVTLKQYIEVLPVVSNTFTTYTIDRDLATLNFCTNADTYVWKFGDNTSSTEFEPTHTYAKDGTFNVELCATNTCGTLCKTSKVFIVTPVEANFTSEIQDGCTTLKVKYKNLSSDNATSYQWSFPGGVPSISKEKEPTISYLSKGIFDTKLTVTNSKYTSTKYEIGFIRVDSKPISQFESKATVGNSIEFVNETIDTIAPWKYSYLWKFGDGMTSKEKSPTHNYSGTGKYNVCLITNNTCSLDTLCKEVEISAVLTSSFTSNTSKGCTPFSVEFKNNSTGASRYLWNFPGGTPSTSTDPNPKVVYSLKGIYDVSLMAYSTSDSALAKQISYISINNLPIAKFGFTINKLKAQFNNQTINGTSYLWKFSDNTTSTEVNPQHDFKAEGEYNTELIAQSECGETRATFKIAIYLIPKVNFSASKTDICVGDHITLNNLSSIDVTDWNWQINGGAPSTSNEKNPVVIFEKAGTYTIKLTVKNSNGENSITKTSYINVKSPVLCPKHKGKETKLVEGSESDESINAKERIGSTEETLEILPNPSNGLIKVILPSKVNMQKSQIEISNVHGVKKFISKLNGNNDHQLDLDLSQEPSGVYLITIYTEDEVSSKKFVIVN